jgi:hypothetical protein
MRRIVTSSIVGVLLCGLAAVQSRAADAVRIPLAGTRER